MWSDAMKAFGLELNKNMEKERSTLSLQFVSRLGGSPLARTYEAVYASILENRELQTSSSERSTRHIEVSLPEGATYKEGDHLGVIPINSEKNVNRIFKTLWIKREGSSHIKRKWAQCKSHTFRQSCSFI